MYTTSITHTHSGLLFSDEKEGKLAIWDNMDGAAGIMLCEVKQTETNAELYPLYVESIWNLKKLSL